MLRRCGHNPSQSSLSPSGQPVPQSPVQLAADPGTNVVGTIELLSDELAVPRKDRVRFGHAGDLGQSSTAQSLANFGECGPLWV
jgi:hypothetical protein